MLFLFSLGSFGTYIQMSEGKYVENPDPKITIATSRQLSSMDNTYIMTLAIVGQALKDKQTVKHCYHLHGQLTNTSAVKTKPKKTKLVGGFNPFQKY